jgi:hypothetical protein
MLHTDTETHKIFVLEFSDKQGKGGVFQFFRNKLMNTAADAIQAH